MADHFYVYPAYLDAKIARADGRRVPRSDTVGDVTSEEIVQAARRLGWRAEVEAEKQYPRRFFTYAGRVKLPKRASVSKAAALRSLGAELQKLRAQAGKK